MSLTSRSSWRDRNFADVGMEEGVIADLVTFALDALHEADILLGLGANHHEGTLDVADLRMSRIFGVHLGSGPSSKEMATSLG